MECLLQKNSVNYYLSKCRPHPVILWPQPRKLVQPLPAKVIILGVHEAIGAPWIMTRAPLVSGGDVWARDPATQPLFISSVDTHDLLSAIINQDFFFFFFFCDCLASFFYALLTPPPDISPTSSPTPHGCVCIHYTATKRYMTSMPDDKLFKLKRKPWQ